MRIVDRAESEKIEELLSQDYLVNKRLRIENMAIRSVDYIQELLREGGSLGEMSFVALIGPGHNGADGLAISRHLANMGLPIRAFLFFQEDEVSEATKEQLRMAVSYGVKITSALNYQAFESYLRQLGEAPLVLDALLGVHFKAPLPALFYEVIELVNKKSGFTISVDIPSGVDADSGEVQGEAIKADLTLSVGYPKLGCFVSDGLEFVGEVINIDVGIPKSFYEDGDKFLLGPDSIVPTDHRRSQFADKKMYGHTLILGGSHGLTGSIAMASRAALEVGAGLVTVATWEDQYMECVPRLIPEVMTGYIPNDDSEWERVIDDFDRYTSVVIGPGLARSELAKKLVEVVLQEFRGPVIVDADALNVMSLKEDKNLFRGRPYSTILTPHFGELAKFVGKSFEEVRGNPLESIKKVVSQTGCTVILKGACTYIGLSNGRTYFNFFPNDGMATAGVGDVLAGVLGGFTAPTHKKLDEEMIVNQAVVIHSLAGYFAAEALGVRSMRATSLIESFPRAFEEVNKVIEEMQEL